MCLLIIPWGLSLANLKRRINEAMSRLVCSMNKLWFAYAGTCKYAHLSVRKHFPGERSSKQHVLVAWHDVTQRSVKPVQEATVTKREHPRNCERRRNQSQKTEGTELSTGTTVHECAVSWGTWRTPAPTNQPFDMTSIT